MFAGKARSLPWKGASERPGTGTSNLAYLASYEENEVLLIQILNYNYSCKDWQRLVS